MRENDIDENVRRVLSILNHLFLLERKIEKLESAPSLQRHTERIVEEFAELGFITENPIGQPYNETRTDCEASIAGESSENLVVVEVAKPLVRHRDGDSTRILQKAVVFVESVSSSLPPDSCKEVLESESETENDPTSIHSLGAANEQKEHGNHSDDAPKTDVPKTIDGENDHINPSDTSTLDSKDQERKGIADEGADAQGSPDLNENSTSESQSTDRARDAKSGSSFRNLIVKHFLTVWERMKKRSNE